VLPLVLGALMEVDEQVLALDTRGAAKGIQRTTLDPPHDSTAQLVVRWLCVIVVLAAWSSRVLDLLLAHSPRLVSLVP